MTQKHTPAPWKVFYAKNNGSLVLGVGQDTGEGIIASNGSFWGEDAEAKANSEHVVKCVNLHDELLEALEGLLEAIWESKIENTPTLSIAGNKAIEAIKKARGEL